MTDNKFTDEEIIKALKCHIEAEDCENCEMFGNCDEIVLTERVLDLINRQNAEIEALKMEFSEMRDKANSYKAENERLNEIIKNCHQEILQKCDSCNNRIKAEACKEFVERLKKDLFYKCGDINYSETCDLRKLIDNLLKEMVGEGM